MTGTGTEAEAALADAAGSADALNTEPDDTAAAAGSEGAAARDAGAAATEGADQAATGWGAVTAALTDYAAKARDIGGDIGQGLVGAFTSAKNAVGEFVKTGKLDFRDLVTSMIADLAKLAARRFILGPIANALSGALGGAGGIFANILHAGGMVGSPGPGRIVPALAFSNAPRMHGGGWAGIKPGEVPAILQRGARGGPERRTQVVELASGDEERNASWANSRRRHDVAYGIRRADDLAAVVAFIAARSASSP